MLNWVKLWLYWCLSGRSVCLRSVGLRSSLAARPGVMVRPLTLLYMHLFCSHITAAFKALMFAYKTTSGSSPVYLNSLLQTYVPLEACVLQVNVALLFTTKRHKIPFTDFYINCSLLTNSIPAAESLAIFKNQLKTHLFHLYLTL